MEGRHEAHKISSDLASSAPCTANFGGGNFVIGGGVAIFHIASARVVILYHPIRKIWFLPKGRRDVNESTESGAEREGYEESGYRNRVLPLSISHLQPQPRIPPDPRFSVYAREPIWLQLVPQTAKSQYLLFWYIAETLSPKLEEQLNRQEDEAEHSIFGAPYQYPPAFPIETSLRDRLAEEPKGYEPVHHTDTSADEEESLCESHLLSVPEAISKLGNSHQADVVKLGWDAIKLRLDSEKTV